MVAVSSICFSATPTSFASVLFCYEKQEGSLSKDAIASLAEKSFSSSHIPFPILVVQTVAIAILFTVGAVGCATMLPMGVACSQGMIIATHFITLITAPIIARINAVTKSNKIAEEKFVGDIAKRAQPFKATYEKNFTGLRWGAQIALLLGTIAHLSDYFVAGQPFITGAAFLSQRQVLIISLTTAAALALATTILTVVSKTKLNPNQLEKAMNHIKTNLERQSDRLTKKTNLSQSGKAKVQILNLQIDAMKTNLAVLTAS